MKKDWTEIMRDKLSENVVTPPDNLWAGISSELDAMAAPTKKTRKFSLIWRFAAVAACLAALIICGVFIYDIDGNADADTEILAVSNHTTQTISVPEQTSGAKNTIAVNTTFTNSAISQKSQVSRHSVSQPKNSEIIPTEENNVADTLVVENIVVDIDYKTSQTECPDTAIADYIDYEKLLLAQAHECLTIEPIIEPPKNISVSIFACNTNMPRIANDGDFVANAGEGFSSCDPKDPAQDTPDESKTTASRATDSYSVKDARHKQPIRVGVSARIPISRYFSIGTGVTYSLLSSTITLADSKAISFDVDQTLHYIGVPFSIDYNLPSYRSMGFYLTAGAMAEKCIYGRARKSTDLISNNVMEQALQLSMFAGAGMQLNLNSHIALYAEPLATFYIDNHSNVKNIYKDRPLNFDLRIGVRYTIK